MLLTVLLVIFAIIALGSKGSRPKDESEGGKSVEHPRIQRPEESTFVLKARESLEAFRAEPTPSSAVLAVYYARKAGLEGSAHEAVDYLKPLEPANGDYQTSYLSRGRPRGLRNPHFICYANAALQALATFRPLLEQHFQEQYLRGTHDLPQKFVNLRQALQDLNPADDMIARTPLEVPVLLRDQPGWDDASCWLRDCVLSGQEPISQVHRMTGLVSAYSEAFLKEYGKYVPMPVQCLGTGYAIGIIKDGRVQTDLSHDGTELESKLSAIGPLLIIKGLEPWPQEQLHLNGNQIKIHAFLDPTSEATYELKAVILTGTGHAYSYVQRLDVIGQQLTWYQCNDSAITEYTESTYALGTPNDARPPFSIPITLNQRPILFYLRIA